MRGCRAAQPDTLSADPTTTDTNGGDSQHLQQQGKYTNIHKQQHGRGLQASFDMGLDLSFKYGVTFIPHNFGVCTT